MKLDTDFPIKGLKGEVEITIFNGDGSIERQMKGKNLIVNGMRDVLGELLLQDLLTGVRTTTQLKITSMRMGGSTVTPAVGQTGLQGTTLVTKTLAAANVTKVSAGVYRMSATVVAGTDATVGTVFNEVGLFTGDSTMVSRQLHGTYTLGTNQSVQYDWTYTFNT